MTQQACLQRATRTIRAPTRPLPRAHASAAASRALRARATSESRGRPLFCHQRDIGSSAGAIRFPAPIAQLQLSHSTQREKPKKSGRMDSNHRPPGLQPGALPIELLPVPRAAGETAAAPGWRGGAMSALSPRGVLEGFESFLRGACFAKAKTKSDTFSIFACHPCAGAMLIFSVSFQFLRMTPKSSETEVAGSPNRRGGGSMGALWLDPPPPSPGRRVPSSLPV